jgi:prolyl-tRNA editing enzyme YbaK/EbsC (Cys-tRNA(Pro) deacylase)
MEVFQMENQLSSSAKRVQKILMASGKNYKVVELPESTRTAKEAASAIGCEQGQIVKSIVFMTSLTRKAVLVIASGINRVNENNISFLLKEPVIKADGDFVRNTTGYAIGGVPPVGHSPDVTIFIDQDLMKYRQVWAAAGTPHAVFELDPSDLPGLTGGMVIDIN